MRIGVVGIGRMGAAIARRLLDCGREVVVWNRTAEKARALVAVGAHAAETPEKLAAECAIVISILTDAAAISAAYEGRDGLLAGEIGGRLFIEMSTVRPAIGQALALKVRAKGAAFVECPVGGTVEPAREGKLLGFAGGENGDVARARQVLEQLCRRIEHVGAVGAGASMKLAINLPLHVYWQALGEALLLCQPLGLPPERLVSIFADTSGAPNVLKARSGVIARAVAGEDTDPAGFDIDSIRKDLLAMIEETRALGGTSPVARRALECFDEAAQEGLGSKSAAALPARWVRRGARRQ